MALLAKVRKSNLVYYGMTKDKTTNGPLLSKWWRTKSAKAAMRRAKAKKQASLQKFLQSHREKQEARRRELEQWKVVA